MEDSIFYYNDNWKKKYVHPDLLSKDWELVKFEFQNNGVDTDIYYIPIFNKVFCDELISLAETAPQGETITEVNGEPVILRGWGRDRHPDYPTYDIELKSIELYAVYESFMHEFIYPLVCYLFSEKKASMSFSSETFLIKYTKEDKNLPCHSDDGMVSLNVSLNDEFTGGGTYFPKQRLLNQPKLGYGIIHPAGLSHRHGARSTLSGTRYQLVSFCNQKQDYIDE